LLRTSLKRSFLVAIAGAAAWLAMGCSGSVAPGYTIEKQRIEVTYSKTAPDRVSVRAWYRIRNSGSQPLEQIHFRLPFRGRTEDLRVEWGGETLVSQSVAGSGVELSVHFNAPWNLKDRKELVLSFDLRTVNPEISFGEGRGPFFFLPSGGWYPYLLPPTVPLSHGGVAPDKWELVVDVPQGYKVHASGTQHGQDHSEARDRTGSSYRFEQKLQTDFEPFVVAGPYVEQQARLGSETVFIWSASPVSQTRIQEISERFGEEAEYFTREYGLRGAGKGQVWLIGCPPGAPILNDEPGRFLSEGSNRLWSSSVNCPTVPQAVIGQLSIDSTEEPDLFVAPSRVDPSGTQFTWPSKDVQLAATWFPFTVHDAPDGP
jgi:hypothetical protein